MNANINLLSLFYSIPTFCDLQPTLQIILKRSVESTGRSSFIFSTSFSILSSTAVLVISPSSPFQMPLDLF
ncbi:uncharacterized protein MONOS_11820 [Monocercomonoides exilis]|uniref:uncharacterized protein n=1 Tax=Monocercomonoides exilis TaxID=2049356 RepID=UPI0035596123|nr:hypothetical protein MONOS_11820 [Monocercomonoides exilis]|eukprot:MONOS_11820.1-p1 / transcript=MONOS_11820.1 / gene=MONOS_11820 / organism=Monocercomonoides_exilis_PA203 / gene_product=unspecified product / transcript_product=unspecified product / location=Mono_scaffold00615:21935-22296(-) / protein_length=71 / sequence_SO=supercontig / SO=protein_coding / is_pseudo=false